MRGLEGVGVEELGCRGLGVGVVGWRVEGGGEMVEGVVKERSGGGGGMRGWRRRNGEGAGGLEGVEGGQMGR